MTNDLKNFLEEKKKEFESQFVTKNTNDWDRLKGVRSQEPLNWINDVILDTHNFVLDLVDKEVNNYIQQNRQKVERTDRYVLDELPTIINQLRV